MGLFDGFLTWFSGLFKKKKDFNLGIYGSPNVGKSTLANKICKDFSGEILSKVSEVPHETREVLKKEKLTLQVDGKLLTLNLLDMPGIATKVDYRDFLQFGIAKGKAQKRASEATKGIIEAVKWMDTVDAAILVMDSTEDPYTQVNLTIIGNFEARNIPVIVAANKIDMKNSNPAKIKEAFPQFEVIGISALTGQNVNALYDMIGKKVS